MMMKMHFLETPCVASAAASLPSDWLLWRSEMVWSPERTRLLCQHRRCFLGLWPRVLLWVYSAPWLLAPPLAFL